MDKIFDQFWSVSFTSALSNFSFIGIQKFQIRVKKIDMALFNFEFDKNLKLLIFNIAMTYFLDRNHKTFYPCNEHLSVVS